MRWKAFKAWDKAISRKALQFEHIKGQYSSLYGKSEKKYQRWANGNQKLQESLCNYWT
jgi:hypothetical protein